MRKMIAARRLRYGTRMLRAGDEFEARPRDARLFVAIGAAREAPKPAPADAQPVDLGPLRAEYERVVGRRPFMGWDAATLRQKMREHGPSGG